VTTERQTQRFKSNATAAAMRQAKYLVSGEENLFDKMHPSLNMVLPHQCRVAVK
jgi:hypothetical protein